MIKNSPIKSLKIRKLLKLLLSISLIFSYQDVFAAPGYCFNQSVTVSDSCSSLNINDGGSYVIDPGVTISNSSFDVMIYSTQGASLINSGTLNGVGRGLEIQAALGRFTNNGTITGSSDVGILYSASSGINGPMINAGDISANTWGVLLQSAAPLTSLTNIGTITSTANANIYVGNNQYNPTYIGTLNNLQGATSSALTYSGLLPEHYNIIIRSSNNYGQLEAIYPSGSMTFGIYGNAVGFAPMTYTNGVGATSTIAASTLGVGRYPSVLSGITTSNLIGLNSSNQITGTYSGLSWTLQLQNGQTSIWDLIVALSGPSAADTLSSMTPNAYALRGAYIQQSAIINNGLSYDCTTFDAKGICLSAGGRVTDTNNPSSNSQGALLIASYRANDNWRIGGYLDQNLSSNDPRGVNLENNNPIAGVFAVWNQNTDGTGYQVRVAAGYSDKDVTISRSAFGATGEAGKGDSSLRTQAYSATVSRGIQLNDSRWIASPYVGVRYTKIKRAGYTEDSSADVTTPLTYAGLSQETTSALAGVRFNGQLAEKVNVMASAGVESDIAQNTGDYAATGVSDLTPIAFNQNVRHVRPVAQAGVSYAIDKRQTVSANLMYRQEAFNSSNSTTGMVTYQVGF